MTNEPSVFDYADFRAYLEAWFRQKKQANPRFSHRLVARRLGSADPSALWRVIQGRGRLSTERVEDFVRVIGLVDHHAEYFRLLVGFGQADSAQERQRAFAAIAELRTRLREPEIDSSRFLYLSDPAYPAVHALSRCSGFRADPEWIAQHLWLAVTPARAQEVLDLLERLGFLVREGDGLIPADPVVRTAERVAALGSYGYHRQSHELAMTVLDRLWDSAESADLAERTAYLGTTLAIPQGRLRDLRRLLWEALTTILHQCESWDEGKDQVVQVAIQMFPISDPTAATDSKKGGPPD